MSTRAPQPKLWDILRGALVARTLAVVADLGVPEALADGPRDVDDLAREAGADPDTLHRMLRALASEKGGFEPTSIEDGLIQARCR